MTDKEKLEKIKALADKMYSRMSYLTSDTRPIRQAMDEYHQFIINEYHKEEPVSNPIDFEKELYKAFGQVKDFTLGMRIAKWFYDMGKNSQEPLIEDLEQAIDTYLATYFGGEKEKQDWPFLKKMAIHFAEWQKEQLMANAVDAQCFGFQGAALFSFRLPSDKYLVGSEAKVIVIKED